MHVRTVPPAPRAPNERWTTDFVSDALADGRWFRVLPIVDLCTRECVGVRIGMSLRSVDVTMALDAAITRRRKPLLLTIDNGSDFTSCHFDAWAFDRRITRSAGSPSSRPVRGPALAPTVSLHR